MIAQRPDRGSVKGGRWRKCKKNEKRVQKNKIKWREGTTRQTRRKS